MTGYSCAAFGSIRQGNEYDGRIVESPKDAAHIFASHYARREFGESGRCYRLRLHATFANGGYGIYQAFIGAPCEGGGTNGLSVWFTLSVDQSDPPTWIGQ